MNKIIIGFAGLLLLAACEKEIELKAEEAEPRIVVNSIFSENDTIWVHLSESRNILYEEELPIIEGATVKLLDEDINEIGEFIYDSEGRYYCPDVFPTAGNVYRLTAEKAGFNEINASSETPSIISISSIDTSAAPSNQLEFNISFMDDASQKNYYGVSIVLNGVYMDEFGEEQMFESPYFSTKEIYVINGGESVDGNKYALEFFFSDEGFNGQMIEFTGYQFLDDFIEPGSYFVVGLKSLSEDLYKYNLSYSKYLETQGSPFAEPVQVYSNINHGFGIFGGSSTYRDTIWVD